MKSRPKVVRDFLDAEARQVRVHWLVRHPNGPVVLSGGKRNRPARVAEPKAAMMAGGFFGTVAGYIACQPDRKEVRSTRLANGTIVMFHYSDSRKAANCPLCIASAAYQSAKEAEEKKDDEKTRALAEAGIRQQEKRRGKAVTKKEA